MHTIDKRRRGGEPMLLEGTPQTAGQWFEQHIGTLITAVVLFVTFVAGYVRLGERVRQNKETVDDLCDRVENVEQHNMRTDIHFDPVRDERRLQNIEGGIKEILAKLEQLKNHGGRKA